MNRAEILDTAKEYITKDRDATHGDAEANFGLIAAYWSAHLGRNIKPHDVAVMMTLLKLARAKANPAHADNWIDGCGYLACGGEIATANQTKGEPMQCEYGVWKPIGTAPKDRPILLLTWEDCGPYYTRDVAWWENDETCDGGGFWSGPLSTLDPLFWTDLPENPPEPEGAE
jgi:hypothetical protein